jgi:flagellar L-ring protein precursor FlgH
MDIIMDRLAGTVLLMALVVLGGCASTGEKMAQKPFPDLDNIDYPEQRHASQGSLYSNGTSLSLYGDSKASQVGDIVTIILVESTNASKSASTNTSKDNSLTVTNPTLLGSPFSTKLPGMLPFGGKSVNLDTSLSSSNAFTGEGDSAQSNEMSGTITAVVTKVLPNGNLIVNGKKRITINSGDEYLQISGIIRPRDINGDNTVQSSKLANAEIAYSGTGNVASVNESGWLTRFFNSKWWPF